MSLEEKPSFQAVLARLPLLADLNERDLQTIAGWARMDHFAAEATLFQQGDACDRMWVVRTGQVKIVHQAEDGREVILELIAPGEAFGGAVLFFPVHPATARALTDVETVSLSQAQYTHLLQQHPGVALKLIRMLGQRLHSMMGLQILAGERVERRMAHILLKLADRVGRTEPEGVLITIPLSRQDLADMAGTTLETAIRTVSRFREQGWLITQRGGYLRLTDYEAIKQMAQS